MSWLDFENCPRIAQPPTEIVAFLALHAASPFLEIGQTTEKLMLFRTCFGMASWTVSLDDQSEMNLKVGVLQANAES